MKVALPNLDQAVQMVSQHGESDIGYLEFHFQRFHETVAQVERARTDGDGRRLLDIGAHWLHQALLFTVAGYEVTATDVPAVLNRASVVSLADARRISLLATESLEYPAESWRALPDASFDVVVVGEVLEHLAFNPRALWAEVRRIARPGGLVLVSTPNAYALRSVIRGSLRWLRGDGWGVSVDEIIVHPTYSHHWKEYSASELRRYFKILVPDSRIEALRRLPNLYPGSRRYRALLGACERMLPPLRSHLFISLRLG